MGIQKSTKGRQSAASQVEEVGRRVTRSKRSLHPGRQQFGGSGSLAAADQDIYSLSNRAKKAIQEISIRRKGVR
jgi:hypothetical protein